MSFDKWFSQAIQDISHTIDSNASIFIKKTIPDVVNFGAGLIKDVIHLPGNIIKETTSGVSNVVKETTSGVGNVIKQTGDSAKNIFEGMTMPLMIGGVALVALLILKK